MVAFSQDLFTRGRWNFQLFLPLYMCNNLETEISATFFFKQMLFLFCNASTLKSVLFFGTLKHFSIFIGFTTVSIPRTSNHFACCSFLTRNSVYKTSKDKLMNEYKSKIQFTPSFIVSKGRKNIKQHSLKAFEVIVRPLILHTKKNIYIVCLNSI